MKNIISIFLVVLLFSLNINAQEVPEIQRPLITKVAATWCPPCGGWAWDLFEDLVVDNDEDAVLIVAHHSGDLVNSVAEDFSENLEAPYQPYIYFNLEDKDATSTNGAAKRTEIQEQVAAAALESPIANAGMNLSLSDSDLTVDTKTIFFQEDSGEFYLGVYYVENEVINFQTGQGNDAVHEKILRGAISSGSFGELIGSGTIEAGTEFTHSFTSTINSTWNVDHLEIITIIWRKVDDTFEVVNTNISTNFETTSAISDINLIKANVKVVPTIVQSNAQVHLDLQDDINAEIFISDIKGAIIQSIFTGNLNKGINKIDFNSNKLITEGSYYIVVKSGNKVVSSPFVKTN